MFKNIFNNIFDPGSEVLFNFQAGYLSGVIITLALFFILVILLYLIFHRKKCDAVVVPGSNGDMIITSNAVNDFIRTFESRFSSIKFSKVHLKKFRDAHMITININYEISGSPLNEEKDMLRDEIFSGLREHFGIESVKKISFRTGKVSSARRKPQAESTD